MGIRNLKIVSNVSDIKAMGEDLPSLKEELSLMDTALGWELQLPFAARELEISPNPSDYVLYPVPIMYSDLPNRNGFAFPLTELVRWNVELGRQAYKGWVGMPMYQEHQSDDHKKACGIVIDTSLRQIKGFGKGKFWKLMGLAALDKVKYPDLVDKMLKKELNSFSMGALVSYCTCSYCGKEVGECTHVSESNDEVTFYELNGRLVFKNVHNIKAYELSVVGDPAFGTAYSENQLIQVNKYPTGEGILTEMTR